MKELIKVVGGNGEVSATVLAHSVSPEGKEIITYELIYPRIVHSEKLTHGLLNARNAASSRAIPVSKVNGMILEKPASPVRFGQHQAGMQDQGSEYEQDVIYDGNTYTGRGLWKKASELAVGVSQAFAEAGYAKQVCNRITEPFQYMKTVLTATELANFFWLRIDMDADPSIYALAKAMKEVKELSTPEPLKSGEWHTPYVNHEWQDSILSYFVMNDEEKVYLSVDEAKAISASCCAQVSFRLLNTTKDKALDIYGKLIKSNKVHSSPFSHQATPIADSRLVDMTDKEYCFYTNDPKESGFWEKGITSVDRNGDFWSGNFKGWIQHRQLLDGHTKWED